MRRLGLYVPKKACFGAKMAVFGPITLIILWGSKSSGTHISENHWGTCSHCFIGRAWHQMDHIGQYLGEDDQKCISWAKFCRFTKILIFTGKSKSFGTQIVSKSFGTQITESDQKFCQWPVRSPREDGQFCTLRLIFRVQVMVIFVKEPDQHAKKSSPTPLWGHCLSVTALALSACRLDISVQIGAFFAIYQPSH